MIIVYIISVRVHIQLKTETLALAHTLTQFTTGEE